MYSVYNVNNQKVRRQPGLSFPPSCRKSFSSGLIWMGLNSPSVFLVPSHSTDWAVHLTKEQKGNRAKHPHRMLLREAVVRVLYVLLLKKIIFNSYGLDNYGIFVTWFGGRRPSCGCQWLKQTCWMWGSRDDKYPRSEQCGTKSWKEFPHIPTTADGWEERRHDSEAWCPGWGKLFFTLGCLLTNLHYWQGNRLGSLSLTHSLS